MSRVAQLTEIEQLDGYQLAWKALLLETRSASFFQSPPWFGAFAEQLSAGQQLRVLVVHSAGRPIGILPLVRTLRETRLGTIRVLGFPHHDSLTTFGPIGPNPTATLHAAMRHLAATSGDWDLLDFRGIDKEAVDRSRTPHAMRRVGFHPREDIWLRTPSVEIDGSWEAYWENRPPLLRETVGRRTDELERVGRVEFHRYRPSGSSWGDDDPQWARVQDCLAMTGETPDARFRAMHQAAARNGAFDLSILRVDGEPVAYSYGFVQDGRLDLVRLESHPRWVAMETESVLMHHLLEDGFRRGDRHWELGQGKYHLKRDWQTTLRSGYRYVHFRSAPRVQALRVGAWLRHRFVQPTSAALV